MDRNASEFKDWWAEQTLIEEELKANLEAGGGHLTESDTDLLLNQVKDIEMPLVNDVMARASARTRSHLEILQSMPNGVLLHTIKSGFSVETRAAARSEWNRRHPRFQI